MTIQNGKMTDIAVLDASGEDKPYYKQALPLLDEMLAVQSAPERFSLPGQQRPLPVPA